MGSDILIKNQSYIFLYTKSDIFSRLAKSYIFVPQKLYFGFSAKVVAVIENFKIFPQLSRKGKYHCRRQYHFGKAKISLFAPRKKYNCRQTISLAPFPNKKILPRSRKDFLLFF